MVYKYRKLSIHEPSKPSIFDIGSMNHLFMCFSLILEILAYSTQQGQDVVNDVGNFGIRSSVFYPEHAPEAHAN